MRVVALLTVRNEERYLARCLEHLYSQGIETCLIDNGSTDNTLEIAESFLGRGVFRIEHFPFNGCFELEKILLNEEKLAAEIDADWFIHHDADEIREAPSPYKTLKEGIEDADRQGYNAINFDEFVFLPTSEEESFEGTDYVKEMRYYYFFEPHPLRRLNAWQRTANINLHSSGGHRVEFAGQKIFPVSFILRHYIFLSKSHVLQKYSRIYSKDRITKFGHNDRTLFKPEYLTFSSKERLKKLNNRHSNWDKSEPWVKHEFLTGNSLANVQSQYLQIKTNSQLSDKLPESQDVSNEPPMPIIVGAARSGKTLLRLMLDAHPDLAIPLETYFIPELLQLKGDSYQLREAFYKQLTACVRWSEFHLSAESFYTHLFNIEPFTIAAGLRCFYQMYAKRFGKSRWGDKTPPYVLRIQDIQTVLPEAHFIHIIRDGRDVALSMKGMWWGVGDDIEEQAIDWVYRIREGRQQAQFCQHYLEVRYEELIANPTKVLQDICTFINLPYNSQMEDYYKLAESRLNEFNTVYKPDGTCIRTKEQSLFIHKLTSQPPDQSRIGRWKREMSNEDKAKYEQIAGAMLRDLGYETGEIKLGSLAFKESNQFALESSVISRLTGGKYFSSRLPEIKANLERSCKQTRHMMLSKSLGQVKIDLERSRSWLAQVQSKLDPASATSFSEKPISTTQEATKTLPSSDRKKHYLSIGAIMKNEAPYLREWIEFHKLVGVERFYLYNNESTDNTVEVLQPYIRSGEVVLEHCPKSIRQMNNAYNHCLENYGPESEWIAFIDVDEFLFPTNEDNLKTILDDYLEYPGLLVNWCCFGSSGHQTKPKGLTIENFTRCANSSCATSRGFKAIVKPSFVQACITAHNFLYVVGVEPVTENKIAFTPVGLRGFQTLTSSWEKIRINHYIIRSREEFIAKRDRGDVVLRLHSDRYTEDFFERHDRDAVEEDFTIQRFLPQLKQNLQNKLQNV